jgi:hypothetical protein
MGDIPSRYIVFDTETKERVITKEPRHVSLHFHLGVAKVVRNPLDGDQSTTYADLHERDDLFRIIDGMVKSKDKIWIFAHNIGFDLRIVGLFDQISNGRYTLLNPNPPANSKKIDTPFIVLDDPPTIIRLFRPDGQELMWVDTWQWLSSSLAKIGKILGNPKIEIDLKTASYEEILTYCRQDVDVLDDAMLRCFSWIRSNGYKAFHPTRAGMAKLIYQQSYERKRIKYHNDPDIQAVERPSYFGGFTECFRTGSLQGKVYQVDANSLYPYVMSKYWYPCEVKSTSLDGSDNTSLVGRAPNRFIAEVYLKSPKNSYPVRCKEGSVFVRGKVRTFLSGPELVRAYKAGDVIKATNYVEYHMQPLFKEFVEDMYAFRMKAKSEGNEIFDYFYKLIMNSLYGKFGQMTAEWEYSGPTDAPTVYAQGYTVIPGRDTPIETRILAGTTFHRQIQVDHPKSFVAIASYVTAYAREYMRSIRESLPERSVYYQATDSMYLSGDGFASLGLRGMINSQKLGSFKHEDTYDSFYIKNIHNLDKGDKKIRGSIKGKAVEKSPDVFEQEAWENLLPGIKARHTSEVHITTATKRMMHEYDRQTVHPDGWCEPHRVDNWRITPEEQSKLWLFRNKSERV